MRKFEKISFEQFEKDFTGHNDLRIVYDNLMLPRRGTAKSAAYDFYAPYAFTLNANEVIMMPTGIKICMNDDEVFEVIVRSSVGIKYNVRMCNQVGIVDADYYNNSKNEGHLWIALQNHGQNSWNVNKNDRVAQGVFLKYLIIDDEEEITTVRVGGIGSTNERNDKNE